MKESYEMPVKQRSRKLFRKFISNSLKNPSVARVLCLPGHEGLEVIQVYDKLGIPRKNITCLERDPEAAKQIKKTLPGVDLVVLDFNEFVGRVGKPFDIVSLDFMGHLGSFENGIYELVQNGLLADKTIVLTNFCGSREGETTQAYYREQGLDLSVNLLSARTYPCHRETERLSQLAQQQENNPFAEVTGKFSRSEAIHLTVAKALMGGVRSRYFDAIEQEFSTIENEMLYRDTVKTSLPGVKLQVERKRGALSLATVIRERNQLIEFLARLLAKRFRTASLVEEAIPLAKGVNTTATNAAYSLSCAFEEYFLDRHTIANRDSRKYVSDRKVPMYLDLFYLERRNTRSWVKLLVDERAPDLTGIIAPLLSLSDHSISAAILQAHYSFKQAAEEYKAPNRAFLGSEFLRAKQESPTPQLTAIELRTLALDRLHKGATVASVAEELNVSKGRVAAWKAHITMGTYT